MSILLGGEGEKIVFRNLWKLYCAREVGEQRVTLEKTVELPCALIILWSHWRMRLSSASEWTRILVMLPSQPTKQLISSVWVQSQLCDWIALYSHQTNVPRQSEPRDPEGRPAESSFLDVQRGICWVWCKDFQGFQYNWVGSCIRFQCWDSFVVVKMSQINAVYAQKYISCWVNKIGLLQTFCHKAHFYLKVSCVTLLPPSL